MKRALVLILSAALWCAHWGIADAEASVDMDLSSFNRIMTYAQMQQVIRDPEAYENRIFRLNGKFNYAQTSGLAKIIISDNAGCCEICMVFLPASDLVFPDDYPPLYADITITGRLAVDRANSDMPAYFADAAVEWEKGEKSK